MAELTADGKDMKILFNSPCHSIIIGSTGSGKTTTFVNPMIQLLAASSAGSSMIMTDPKGELFSLHSGFLKERGYDGIYVFDTGASGFRAPSAPGFQPAGSFRFFQGAHPALG
jgi:type IV secretory pathway TraG/TraD family ATPase VirD4